MDDLQKYRQLIDQADQQLAQSFEQRFHAVAGVGAYKRAHNLSVYDPVREKEVLQRNTRRINDPDIRPYYQRLLQYMMDLAKEYQEQLALEKTDGQ